MGMYNIIFGVNPVAGTLLQTLGLTVHDVGRFRDAFAINGEIVVYTRNGGGNRDDHSAIFAKLREHPNYLRDQDDKFDSTYCTIYFSYPAEYAARLREIEVKESWDPDKRWKDAIERMGSADVT